MPEAAGYPLVDLYQRRIARAALFVETPDADVLLIQPAPEATDLEHCAALDALVSRGTLSDYRYIGAQPQPAILGIRSRSRGPRGAQPGDA